MKRDVPNESRLAALIAQAFESLPPPDPRRLAAIEARLALPRRGRLAYWWLVAMAAAGAAAAWWAVHYDKSNERELVPSVTTPELHKSRQRAPDDTASIAHHAPVLKKGNPIIYQRGE